MSQAVVVVPCYNEEKRLAVAPFQVILDGCDAALRFVDDGSTDRTSQVLAEMCETLGARASWTSLAQNSGKAEAVRQGLLAAIAEGADVVGYIDADMAVPAGEVVRLVALQRESDTPVVLAARVALAGHDIKRKASRHYLGRVFSTAASLILGAPIYDTQCGAKLFAVNDALREALGSPFNSRWAFDVELLGRLMTGPAATRLTIDDVLEMPLDAWSDVAGSKLGPSSMVRAGLDLVTIAQRLQRRRRG